MPLLGRDEFVLKQLPPNLDLNHEVFYCSQTGEAFLTYDEYFERQILCSSMLWTCSVTGKTNLTYADAIRSEKEHQTILSTIPRVLQKVILYLMKFINNFSTNVTLAVLFDFTNMRFFIGEMVFIQSTVNNKIKRTKGYIRDVIPPEDSKHATSISYGLDPLSYQYVVEIIDPKSSDENVIEVFPASRLKRSKFSLTRDKLRLFLKQHLSVKSSRYDTLSIKEESIKKFGLDHLRWEALFKGPTPNFDDDTTVLKAFSKRLSDGGEIVVYGSNDADDAENADENAPSKTVVKKKSNLLKEQKEKLIKREEKLKEKSQAEEGTSSSGKKKRSKKQKLKDKAKLLKNKKKKKGKGGKNVPEPEEPKEDKEAARKKLRDARRKFEEDTRIWMEKRDDLLCDDLKPLPAPTPVDCGIDSTLFGDTLLTLEFINVFQEYIDDFSSPFPSGISIQLFLQILNDSDVNGPYSDLLLRLFDTVLMSNRDGDEEADLKINNANDDEFATYNEDDETTNFCNNNYSNHWVSTYFGTREQLSKLSLDAFTLSEILRIYILKARNTDFKRARHDDDSDVQLAIKLTTNNVFELSPTERLSLFKLLLDDLLETPGVRLKMEDSMDEMFRLKNQIRHHNASYTRWLRDHPVRLRIRKKKPLSDAAEENKDENGEEQVENESTEAEKEAFKIEKAQREQEMKANISKLKAEIRKHSAFCRPRPIGMDRAFRRYWVFQSLRGLLVEHPVEVRSCLDSPSVIKKPKLADYLPNAKRRKSKAAKKEDSSNNVAPANNAAAGDESASKSVLSNEHLFVCCTGNISTCSVHGAANSEKRVSWSFYTKEQLDDLIASLNSRGYRENDLKNSLNIEKDSILKDHLEQFVPTTLNNNYVPPPPPPPPLVASEQVDSSDESNLLRKSERIQNIIYEKAILGPKLTAPVTVHVPSDTKYSTTLPAEAHAAQLAERLLELEDRVFNSCFSSFSLEERDQWWSSVTDNKASDNVKSIENLTALFRTLAKSLRSFCILPPLSTFPDSTASSPSDKENMEHVLPKVPKLSEKWLDVLKLANGLTTGQLNDFESSFGISNLSQIYVNMYIFEKSLNWDLSAMKTANKCRVCRRKANDEMILCDKCNRGYHIYCLKPPINSIDEIEGDWFCYTCVPSTAEAPSTSKKSDPKASSKLSTKNDVNPKVNEAEKVDEKPPVKSPEPECSTSRGENPEEICLACKDQLDDKYDEVSCKSCSRVYHLHCVNLMRVPRSWCCMRCEIQERYNNVSKPEDSGADVRRSSRKRRPNHYFDDDADSADEGQSFSSLKTRRHSYEETNSRTQRVS